MFSAKIERISAGMRRLSAVVGTETDVETLTGQLIALAVACNRLCPSLLSEMDVYSSLLQ